MLSWFLRQKTFFQEAVAIQSQSKRSEEIEGIQECPRYSATFLPKTLISILIGSRESLSSDHKSSVYLSVYKDAVRHTWKLHGMKSLVYPSPLTVVRYWGSSLSCLFHFLYCVALFGKGFVVLQPPILLFFWGGWRKGCCFDWFLLVLFY